MNTVLDDPQREETRRLRRRRIIIVVVAVVLLIAVLAGLKVWQIMSMISKMKAAGQPAQTVTTITASSSDWQPELSAVGSLRAVRGVNITTELAGLVRSVDFKSGDDAKAGQVLVQLNADSDVATLHSLQAAADLAQTVYARDKVQFEAQAISQAQLDAQAAIVAKKALRAPFAGHLGITTVNPGQYLNTGDKVVSLQALDPIYVDFRLPQEQLTLVHPGSPVGLTSDAFPNVSFSGKVNAIDPAIEP